VTPSSGKTSKSRTSFSWCTAGAEAAPVDILTGMGLGLASGVGTIERALVLQRTMGRAEGEDSHDNRRLHVGLCGSTHGEQRVKPLELWSLLGLPFVAAARLYHPDSADSQS
jgi:hypothetical protein